ncbi:hypothetical protein IWZ03DRAFT_411169 [Phyllosticta citriasiana]|uniref:Uncharacterized protein n=1 Tax=Phyllosticta citriasiana TaxID=595635 RepID=A0ABR1KZX5_9PEZI
MTQVVAPPPAANSPYASLRPPPPSPSTCSALECHSRQITELQVARLGARKMASSAVSTFPQQVAKMLSRKSVAIPIAAGSIILFLQWRKRRSQTSWLKSSKPEQSPESHKTHDETNSVEARSKDTETTADQATVPQARLWSSQEELGTAYLNAKRPRLDTGEGVKQAPTDEKPYAEVRTDSFLPVLDIATPGPTQASRRESRRESIQVDTTVQLTYETAPWPGSAGMAPTFSTIVEAAETEPLSAASSIFSNPFKDENSAVPTPDTSFGDFNFGRRDTLTPNNDARFARKQSIQVDTIVEHSVETTEADVKPWVETVVSATGSIPVSDNDDGEDNEANMSVELPPEEALGRRQSIQVDTVVSRTVSPAPPSNDSIPRVESIVEADADLDPMDPLAPTPLQPPQLKVDTPQDTASPALSAARSSDAELDPLSPLPPPSSTSPLSTSNHDSLLAQPPVDRLVHVYSDDDAPLKHLPGMGVPNSARDALVMRVRQHSVADAVVDAEEALDDARSREGLVAVLEGAAPPAPSKEPVSAVVPEREWLPGFGVPNA